MDSNINPSQFYFFLQILKICPATACKKSVRNLTAEKSEIISQSNSERLRQSGTVKITDIPIDSSVQILLETVSQVIEGKAEGNQFFSSPSDRPGSHRRFQRSFRYEKIRRTEILMRSNSPAGQKRAYIVSMSSLPDLIILSPIHATTQFKSVPIAF